MGEAEREVTRRRGCVIDCLRLILEQQKEEYANSEEETKDDEKKPVTANLSRYGGLDGLDVVIGGVRTGNRIDRAAKV